MTSTRSSEFRSDINGLRAWAVLVVVLYHFDIPGFGGGFVGVDVFFVISGFLMTGIVVKGLEAERFSLLGFYLARARRIVPALWVLCACLLVLGWFFLLPPDYKTLGVHSVTAMGFWSNLRFWGEAGYFDVSSHQKWLLHTWSLSVEWQFYILLPGAIMLMWRLWPRRGVLVAACLVGAVASLVSSVWLTSTDATQAFYSLHTRAWEMLVGGLVFLLASQRPPGEVAGRLAEWTGLAFIALSVLVFDVHSAWPGANAMLPVAGAVLVLWARRPQSLFTGNSAARWLGDRSYSVYLWHWPVVVALTYVNLLKEPAYVVAGLVVTLLLASASYRWVETWGQGRPTAQGKVNRLAGYTMAVIVLCAPAVLIWKLEGVGGRMPAIAEQAAAEAENTNPLSRKCITPEGTTIIPCRHGGPERRLILMGDSHSGTIVSALEAALPNPNDGFEQWSYAACPMIRGALPSPGTFTHQRKNYHCAAALEQGIKELETIDPAIPLMIVTRTSLALHGLNELGSPQPPEFYIGTPVRSATPESIKALQDAYVETVCTIAARRRVLLLRPIPEMGFDVPQVASRQLAAGIRSEIGISYEEYLERNKSAWDMQNTASEQCEVEIIDPTQLLCQQGRCMATQDFLPLYSDDDHLSETGNRVLYQLMRQAMS